MYKITIEKRDKAIEEKMFKTMLDAKKCIKEMMKKYNLIKHSGHIVNYSEYTELWTNF